MSNEPDLTWSDFFCIVATITFICLVAYYKSRKVCGNGFHRFALEDLHKTGDGEDSDTRVEWACTDCGKVFSAHCGLDIAPRHGFMFRRGQS